MVKSMPHTLARQHRRGTQRGAMLIEVLVAILIFSIGVLALVGLQARMTKAQSEAKYRADASYLANEIIGVMWGDIANRANYNGQTCASHPRCNDWLGKVSSTLPGGSGAISIDAATQVITITVNWQLSGEEAHSYSTRTTLNEAG